MRYSHSILRLTAAALLAAACADSSGPAYLITALRGDRQADSVGRPLATPLTVRVTDAAGVPQAGLAIRWEATPSTTSVVPASAATDAGGEASATVTLGGTQGLQIVRARVGDDQFAFNLYAFGTGLLLTSIAIPQNYGIHDTYVRDGIAFVCAWDDGVRTYDVGNGIRGGTPWLPVLVSHFRPQGWGNAHNAWWFHNPNTSERRYLFVGEEGTGEVGASSSGDIHVLDVSDLANPVDVATYRVLGAGPHNFWMDEDAEILYAAYYNAGVLAIDVSGTLSGNLPPATRLLSSTRPGGAGNTFTWGVHLANGFLYAIDMLSGLWQLAPGPPFVPQAGSGNNVLERFSSDLWIHGDYAFTGTWGYRGDFGNAVKIWHLEPGGAPVLVDSIVVPDIGTVSDVEVSADGKLLMFSAESGTGSGIYWYDLTADPAHPAFIAHYQVADGVHTATFASIGGRLYAFGARNPIGPALLIYDVTRLLSP